MKIMEMLHKKNPYDEFRTEGNGIKPFHQGWHGNSPIFRELLYRFWFDCNRENLRIVEVGSWLGQSANNMASIIKSSVPYMHPREKDAPLVTSPKNLEVICVDTWLGAEEFWDKEDIRYEWLNLYCGYPQCYKQFLCNTIDLGNQDIITPFPIGSLQAAEWFKRKGLKADVIYIDAGHSYNSVLADLKAWWPILNKGGMMFGDDLVGPFDGVQRAVQEFFNGTYDESGDGIFWAKNK